MTRLQGRSPQGWKRALFTSAPFAAVVVSKIVAGFQSSQSRGLATLNVVLTVAGIVLGLLLIVFALADVADVLRSRSVGRLRPDASLLFGRWTLQLVEGVERAGLGQCPKYLGSFTVAVDESGLSLWRGIARVSEFATIPWQRVERVSIGSDRDAQGVVEVLLLDVTREGPATAVSLAVSRHWWQGGIAPSADLSSIAEELRHHLSDGRTSRV